jgi:c-di-GMP-binding flagellar brake protein YcgR
VIVSVLLQHDISFFSQPDPRSTRVTLIVFGALILIGVIVAIVNARRSAAGRGKGGSRLGLNRQSKHMGLDASQRKILRDMARALGLQSPERLLTNPAYMNHAMRRRFEQIDMLDEPEAVREQRKSQLFAVKRSILSATARLRVVPSSRHFRAGQAVHIRTADNQTYDSMIASNVHNGLGIDLPQQLRGSALWSKGTELQVSVVADTDHLYSFRTRVIGYNNARGASVMFIAHASNIRQTQKRRSPRREYDHPCYFYPVTVIAVGRGRKARKQAFVNKSRRIYGRFEDLSGGGCAIRTQYPLTAGSILKVDFETIDGTPISVFGKVRSVDRKRPRGRLMHIMFTRVSRKNLNQIQSYVYGLVEREEHA